MHCATYPLPTHVVAQFIVPSTLSLPIHVVAQFIVPPALSSKQDTAGM